VHMHVLPRPPLPPERADYLTIVPTEAEVITRIVDADAWYQKAEDIVKALPGPHAVGAAAGGCRCSRVLINHFFLIRRSHSISFTSNPKYKVGFGRGKGWESWGNWLRGGGGTLALAMPLALHYMGSRSVRRGPLQPVHWQ
jgi:hypothetical protein